MAQDFGLTAEERDVLIQLYDDFYRACYQSVLAQGLVQDGYYHAREDADLLLAYCGR